MFWTAGDQSPAVSKHQVGMTGREAEKEVLRTLDKVLSPRTVLLSDLACLNRFLFNIKPRHCKQVYNEGHLTRQVSQKGGRRLKI